MAKRLAILGASGSIGRQALDIVRQHPEDFKVETLAYHSNIQLALEHIHEFKPSLVAMYDQKSAEMLRKQTQCRIVFAQEGVIEAACHPQVDFVVVSIVGIGGLQPTMAAIREKKQIGLANKEVLVAAGDLVMGLAREYGVDILPIDSEHSAIFQCLQGESVDSVHRIVITASGGSFRGFTQEQLESVTLQDALKHPNWSMGPKITIDSSTLMNKGLEMIEARHLFNLSPHQIEAVIHPQSYVHSFVEFCDGSMTAQITEPDMHLPILYAMSYPQRKHRALSSFDFTRLREFTFYPPNEALFPCLRLSKIAMSIGGSLPCFMNAANEVLVQKFLDGEISWIQIGTYLEKVMQDHRPVHNLDLKIILEVDQEARRQVCALC